VHRLPREVLRKRDRHRTSTKFRLGVVRRVHELFKRPSCVKSLRTHFENMFTQMSRCTSSHCYLCIISSVLSTSLLSNAIKMLPTFRDIQTLRICKRLSSFYACAYRTPKKRNIESCLFHRAVPFAWRMFYNSMTNIALLN